MIVKIDIRETALISTIQKHISITPSFESIQLQTESLPIGDIVIATETEDIVIIERKTLNDLLSSIKDGRYEEQSYRLNGLPHHNHNIIYLIEGDVQKLNKYKPTFQTEKQTLYSAMFSLNFYKGFSLYRSMDMDETAVIICNMVVKLMKNMALNKKPYYTHLTEESGKEKEYVNVVKKVKKDNITPDNIGEIMLCTIPGITPVTAVPIMQKYQTLPALIESLKNDPDCLQHITYTNDKGATRKLNKTYISNIVKFLLRPT
jgi:ERCC4-type nuclease